MVLSGEGVWVVTIGDELLRGEIVDSNKSFLSERMLELELECTRHVTVADDPAAISEVLREGARRAKVVLCSGGLGPTRDDITSAVAAETFGRPLRRDPEALATIAAFFARVGREMAENNAKQADFPEGAEVLANPVGTAPGFMLEESGALLFFMPGVPRELYRMTDEQVMPRIRARLAAGRVVRATLLRTFGMGESNLDRLLSDLSDETRGITLGYRTQFPDNLVRVLVRAADAAAAEALRREVIERVAERLEHVLVGEGEAHLNHIVGQLLIDSRKTVAVAESCSGGLIASLLTDVPGSSAYLQLAVVAYANQAKVAQLGVSQAALDAHGAVSEPVARQMAEGVRARAGTDLGVSTTGIAGPDGGGAEKPVGTVFVGLADAAGSEVRRYQLTGDRARNKALTAQIALDWIRRRLRGLPLPDETFPRLGGRSR